MYVLYTKAQYDQLAVQNDKIDKMEPVKCMALNAWNILDSIAYEPGIRPQ